VPYFISSSMRMIVRPIGTGFTAASVLVATRLSLHLHSTVLRNAVVCPLFAMIQKGSAKC
jgi:hypothetical protein